MKKVILTTLLSSFVFSTPLKAQGFLDTGIQVVGKASMAQVPDTFMVRLNIEQKGRSASKLKTVLDNKTSLLTDKALSLGVAAKAIKSSELTIRIIYPEKNNTVNESYHKTNKGVVSLDLNKETYPKKDVEFVVARSIEITFDDISLYDQLIDNAVKIGVTRIEPVRSYVAANDTAYQQLLQQALVNAQEKAQSMVNKLGSTLGKVYSIEELSHYQSRPAMLMAESRSMHKSYVGSQSLTAEVRVRFAIEQ